jgi:predicted regulator of Ras-like GTPase activity (Roadblock/LC7/MglB family)
MSSTSFTKDQTTKIESMLSNLSAECGLDAVAVCDTGGNIVASQVPGKHDAFDNAAALAAGSFAATRELASIIGEKGFHTIMHKGAVKGLLIQALGEEFIVVIFLGTDSVEGMVRLILKKIAPQILSILEGADDSAGEGPGDLEIKRADS